MATTTTNLLLKVWNDLSDKFNHTELAQNWAYIDVHDHTGAGKGLLLPPGSLEPGAVLNENLDTEAVDTNVIADDAITADQVAALAIIKGKLATAVQQALVPTGSLLAYAGATAPTGYLLCNGASVLRATYPDLFAAIGTVYGAVDGTQFTLPDLRGRVPVGVDGVAARLTANDALGQSGGEEKHALTPAEAPPLFNAGAVYADGAARSAVVTTTGANGTAHNNMQPYQIANYIIKL